MIKSTKGLEAGQKLMLYYSEIITDTNKEVLCAIDHVYNDNTLCISPFENDTHELSMGIVLNVTDLWNNRNEYFHSSDAMGAKYRVLDIESIVN